MTRAARFNVDGNIVDVIWESEDFSSYGLSDGLTKYGVYVSEEDGSINVSDFAGRDYQKHAALHEFFCTNPEKLQLLGIDCCATLEKKIILEVVPSKKRARFARQRLTMFNAAIIHNGPESKFHDQLEHSKKMLEELIPTL